MNVSSGGPPANVGVAPVGLHVLRTAFEQAPFAVGVCDENGRFVLVNGSLARLLRLDRDDIVGRPFIVFVHPDHRSAGLAWYFTSVVAAAAQPARHAEHGELRCVCGDGTLLWVAVTWTITSPDDRGAQFAIIHMRDVTKHRAAERELAAAWRRVELAFDSTPIGKAVVGPPRRR